MKLKQKKKKKKKRLTACKPVFELVEYKFLLVRSKAQILSGYKNSTTVVHMIITK